MSKYQCDGHWPETLLTSTELGDALSWYLESRMVVQKVFFSLMSSVLISCSQKMSAMLQTSLICFKPRTCRKLVSSNIWGESRATRTLALKQFYWPKFWSSVSCRLALHWNIMTFFSLLAERIFLIFLTSSKMHSSFGLTSLNVHRIAISALLLGAKLSRDRYFTNVSWVYHCIRLCNVIWLIPDALRQSCWSINSRAQGVGNGIQRRER